jgi:hypothetical protein
METDQQIIYRKIWIPGHYIHRRSRQPWSWYEKQYKEVLEELEKKPLTYRSLLNKLDPEKNKREYSSYWPGLSSLLQCLKKHKKVAYNKPYWRVIFYGKE